MEGVGEANSTEATWLDLYQVKGIGKRSTNLTPNEDRLQKENFVVHLPLSVESFFRVLKTK